MYIREAVRKAHFKDGKSIRCIVRELGVARNTVRKILAEETPEPPRYHLEKGKSKPVLGSVIPIIETWLAEDEQAPRKQRHTAKRIYDRLREEYDFNGSERTVRKYVAKCRQNPKEVFLPLGFEPGEMAQVDWIEEVTVYIKQKPCRINIFGLTLNYSGAIYFEAFERRNQESFLQGHANAFSELGGVPTTLTYDNLKTAVTKVLQGKNRIENERFVAFRSAYLFDSLFCQPGKGNEKGRVENMVKFAERNLLTPVPRVDSLGELNELLLERCRAYQARIQTRQRETVGKRLEEERPHFLPLPKYLPACCRLVSVKANKFSLVQFETNRYSVPEEYAYQTLWLKAFVDRIEVTNREKTIAVHPRLSGRFEESIRSEHYRKSLERKPGGLKHLRATDKGALPAKVREPKRSAYPLVYVRPPDLSIYRQLLRNPEAYEQTSRLSPGYLPQEVETPRHCQAVP